LSLAIAPFFWAKEKNGHPALYSYSLFAVSGRVPTRISGSHRALDPQRHDPVAVSHLVKKEATYNSGRILATAETNAAEVHRE
jgi:hypothetical protein